MYYIYLVHYFRFFMPVSPLNLRVLKQATRWAACLTHADRLRLLHLIEEGGGRYTVCEMARALGLCQSDVSQQLRFMKERDLITATRHGQRMYYELAKPAQAVVAFTLAQIRLSLPE